MLESSELDGAVVGCRACYRVACEGVSLLRQVFEPPVIEEPSVDDTWVTFRPRNDLYCIVVPLETESDVQFAFFFSHLFLAITGKEPTKKVNNMTNRVPFITQTS